MIDSARLATVIFDKGRKITQAQYEEICGLIESDSFTLNEFVIEYKKKDSIMENLFFTLKDGSRILLEENLLNTIENLNLDKNTLVEFMGMNQTNFQNVIREIVNGIE